MNATAKTHMLCWKPGTDDVWLCPWPDPGDRSRGYWTALACYTHVQHADARIRKMIVFVEAMHLIVRDRCDPQAVHRALLGLDEYRSGCSDDMPGFLDAERRYGGDE